ncbi:MAG: glycosyltransferase [Deltaproteobacteria bacterium]|nr:glycosyltransferase [Deltaproteobacteria bacterium]
MTMPSFNEKISAQFQAFIDSQEKRFDGDCFQMDLHCHDRNSDVPDELIGRILRSRETWLDTDVLVDRLTQNGQKVFTITNHNNARSCYALQNAGHDVLVGAEFTCAVPQFNHVSVHVLTYGFSPSEERRLNSLRSNLMDFLSFSKERNLATVLAHPLFFYDPNNNSSVELIELFTLLFENFEVVNGQRDVRQALLMAKWLDTLTPEKIDILGKKHGINPGIFSERPYVKAMTGGSDCHMGMFAGTCGTRFHVPDLENRLRTASYSELALQALRMGNVAPFGSVVGGEKMTAAFLHFFCQLTMYLDDPGLLRLLLHKGTGADKMTAFIILNAIMELRRHKYTSRFLRTLHDALNGKKPGLMIRSITSKAYRGVLQELDKLADARRSDSARFVRQLEQSIPNVMDQLLEVLSKRVENKMKQAEKQHGDSASQWPSIKNIEAPVYLRTWFQSVSPSSNPDAKRLDVASWSDGLPFPALAASCVLGAKFTSARVQHANRAFLNEFARHAGAECPSDSILWISDTYYEKNGVGNSLRLFYDAALQYDLPIHFAVSSHRNYEAEQFSEFAAPFMFEVPFYRDQTLRFPNVLDLEKSFFDNSCTHIVVSTEGPMGLCALYLKMAYNVPAYFYLHTDWIEYAKQSLQFEPASIDRLRRMLRWFYSQFDGIFVLNSEHAEWLSGNDMAIPRQKIHITAHWCNPMFFPRPVDRQTVLPGCVNGPTLLYAGRLSKEKGVLDLPPVYNAIIESHPNARMIVVGSGPEQDVLKRDMPQAVFMDWVPKSVLANIYAACDILLFPSTFDTFGNAVLEALASGTPAIAYNCKGPRDIIIDGESGYLVENMEEMIHRIRLILDDEPLLHKLRLGARRRSIDFKKESIIRQMMHEMNISLPKIAKRTPPLDAHQRKSA